VDKHTAAQDCRYRFDELFVFSSLFSLSSSWKNKEDSFNLIFISNVILIFLLLFVLLLMLIEVYFFIQFCP
jgi:hypothetical protein